MSNFATVRDFVDVTRKLGVGQVKNFYDFLDGIEYQDVDKAQAEAGVNDEEQKAINVFRKWDMLSDDPPTKEAMVNALRSCRFNRIAKEFDVLWELSAPTVPTQPTNTDDQVTPDSNGLYLAYSIKEGVEPQNIFKCYPSLLGSKQKGLAYIMNVLNVKGQSPRRGADVDFKNANHLFKDLGYVVESHEDLSAQMIVSTIGAFADKFKEEHASCVVFLMSHGEHGVILGTDGQAVEIQSILDKFKCNALVNKPKLFFIQACRGSRKETTQLVQTDATKKETMIDVPRNADFHVAYATTDGYLSIRNAVNGAWFVQAIMEIFLSSAHEESLGDMMNQVNDRVAKMRGRFFDPESVSFQDIKQMPRVDHSLRKKVYFFPKKSLTL